jgi:hypothetical protein
MTRVELIRRFLMMFVLFALAACDPPPQTGDFSLLASKDTVSLAIGASTSLNITVVPSNGFKNDVSFSATEVTGKIISTFTPVSSSSSTSLKLEVAASAAVKDYAVVIKGSSSINGTPLEHSITVTVTVTTPPGIQIGGTIKNAFGNPLENATVSIGLKTTATNAAGAFTLTDIATPYTITVQPVGTSIKHEFINLTRADPTLVLFGFQGGVPLSTSSTLNGTLSAGAGFPNPANHSAYVAFASPTGGTGIQTLLPSQGPNYSFDATWTGSSLQAGTLFALQGSVVPSIPTLLAFANYTGFAKKSISLSNGIPSANNLALTAVTNQAMTINLTLPAGAALSQKRMFLTLGSRSAFPLSVDTGTALSSTYATPAVGQTLGVVINAKVGSRAIIWQKVGLQANEIVSANLPTPVLLTAPSGAPNSVPLNTTLTWSNVPNSVYLLALGATVVYTTQPAYATTLNANTSYGWIVSSVGSFSSLDEFAGDRLSNGYPIPFYDQSFVNTTSDPDSFKTVP